MSSEARDLDVDVAIIGAGTAGIGAFHEARKSSDRVIVIEGGEFGTTCARTGCMPSKLLLAAAKTCRQVSHADRFGVIAGTPRVDGAKVMARLQRLRDEFVGHVRAEIDSWPPDQVVTAKASFADDRSLALSDGRTVHAKAIVIATGSSPNIPDTVAPAGPALFTTDTLFDREDLPKSAIVVGAGAIGVEIGQALAFLGVETTLLGQAGDVGGLTDPAILCEARRILAGQLTFVPDQSMKSVRATDAGAEVTADVDGARTTFEAETIIAATGRAPNVGALCLERTSIECDEKGVPKFDPATGRTSVGHVFIAGDANGDLPLLHEASFEGKLAGTSAARSNAPGSTPRPVPLRIVFGEPGIAMVGRSHRELTESDTRFLAGAAEFSDQGRARVDARAAGRLHVYGEPRTGRLLGAEMVAPDAEHLGHLIAWAMQCGAGVKDMVRFPFYHPTTAEGLRSALRDLNRQLGQEDEVPARDIDCGPGC